MKKAVLLLALPFALALAACDQKPKSTAEQVKDRVNDALDRRPNEKLKDAAEDLRSVGGAAERIKDKLSGKS